MSPCPRCARPGRAISPATLLAQAPPRSADDAAGWSACQTPTCPAGYFRGADVIDAVALAARPFHKGESPDRLVCFCFQRSAAQVRADPTIRDAIRAACRDGQPACETQNPAGRCCLGDVGRVLGAPAPSMRSGCCDASANGTHARHGSSSQP